MNPVRFSLLPLVLACASTLTSAQVTTFTICGTVDVIVGPPLSAPWNSVAVGDPFSLTYTFDCAATDSDASTTFGYYPSSMTAFTFTAGTGSSAQVIPPATGELAISSGQPPGVDQYESLMSWPSYQIFFELYDASGTAYNGNVPRDGLPCCVDLSAFGQKLLQLQETFGGSFYGTITGCTTCYHARMNPTCANFDTPAMDGWAGIGVGTALPTPGPSGLATDHYLESTDQNGASYLESAAYAGDWLSLVGSGCAAIEFDVQITSDGMSGSPTVRPVMVLSDTGGSPIQAAFRTTIEMTEPAGIAPGWHHVVAPLAPLSFGVLPSGPDGHWEMISPWVNTDWDTLLSSVATIRFHNDFTAGGPEILGYDNVCLTDQGCVCSGKRPQYATSAWPRSGSVAAATGDAGPDPQDPMDLSPFVVHVIDLTTIGSATPGVNFGAAFYHHPSWKKSVLGTVFGVALDGEGNVYVAHSSVYGYGIGPTDAVGFGGAGAIYKLDKAVGVASLFATLPNALDGSILPVSEAYPGLGDLAYDCRYDHLYASNLEDGKIYIYNMNGALAGPLYDHGAADNGVPGFSPLGDRVWAVAVHAGRLYYSIWVEDEGRPDANRANEIWSVGLDATGLPSGAPVLEISMPVYEDDWSNPVAGIGFSDEGLMLVAERSMDSNTTSNAHLSWGSEYVFSGTWNPTANSPLSISSLIHSTAGGCDYEHGSNSGQRRWFSGDHLVNVFGNRIYGLQGAPAVNPSDPWTSVLIDLDQNTTGVDKLQIGDVKISCGEGIPDEPGRKSCAGDGMPFPCPCGNIAALAHGCVNGTGQGAQLCATGLAYSEYAGGFGADTVQFQVMGVPGNAPCLLYSGTLGLTPPPFLYNGIRCCGGVTLRLAIHQAVSGATTFGYPNISEVISVLSTAPAGTSRCYQVWYRDTLGPCGLLANLTNGYDIAWH